MTLAQDPSGIDLGLLADVLSAPENGRSPAVQAEPRTLSPAH
jgi:hypothetical protein